MRKFLSFFVLLAASLACSAQIISTVAGGGVGDGLPAVQAGLNFPQQLAIDAAGNVFIAESGRVRRVDAGTGVITTVVGTGERYYSGDGGPATAARLRPTGVVVDGSGNLIVADGGNYVVRRVDAASGMISTIAGVHPNWGFYGDGGLATAAYMTFLGQIARDAAGDLYIADQNNHRIRKVTLSTGIITTVAGGGGNPDGASAVNASLNLPYGVAVDAAGNLYIAESVGNRVRKVAAGTGIISTVAGTGATGFSGDGAAATLATLNTPVALAVDAAGNLFIADSMNARVRRVDAGTGIITTVAGGGAGLDGGPAAGALLVRPYGLAIDGAGRLYISDADDNRVRRVEGGTITTFAGASPYVGDGLSATQARVASPYGIAFDASGNMFIADSEQRRVRRVDAATGVITTLAGNGSTGSLGDGGQATAASLTPRSLAVDAAGNVYIGDIVANRVRKVAVASGIITTFAGDGGTAYGSDGAIATAASMVPHALVFDSAGNLYVGDASANRAVRRIAAGSTVVTTVAASVAAMSLAVDTADNVYIGALQGGIYRLLASSGVVESYAGVAGSFGVVALAVDAAGNAYAVDLSSAGRVYRIAAGTRASTLFAGGAFFFASPLGDGGPATSASLSNQVQGLAYKPGGIYISDTLNNRVRKVTLPALFANPQAVAFEGRLPQTTSLARRVVLTNQGASSITINSIAIASPFAVTHDCGATLAGGASCNADITFSPGAVGSFGAPLIVNASSGIENVPVSGAGELSLVTHYYETILRRAPDSSGKPFWDGERTRMQNLGANVNETWFAMSSFFYASNEYQAFNRNPSDFTTDLYKTFFNRAPDGPGLQFWIGQMSNGMPREVVLTSFQHSAEFKTFTQAIFGNTAARAEVDMVMDFYRGLLGRLPDTSGFNNWVSQFRSAQCSGNPGTAVASTAASISEQFALSGEYVNKGRNNSQYVGDLYNAFLRRGGDLTGVLTWINALNDNTFTRKQVRDEFRKSSEFTARIDNVASQVCLQ